MMFCLIFLFLVTVNAGAAQILYGADRASNLYTIDYVNGAAHLIGSLGFAQASAFTINKATGDAFASPGGGGCCPQTISGCLYSVDLANGAATQIGCDPMQEGLDPFSDFAFHSNGTMYALRLACNAAPHDCGMYLCTINLTTGVISDIGQAASYWWTGYSLAFVSDILYRWDTQYGLSTLDPTTAARTVIGYGDNIGFPVDTDVRIPAMAASQDGTLYGIGVEGGPGDYTYLVTINKANGDVTYVATLPQGMQNLAFSGTVADGCPWDPDKTEPGICGCGVTESATDSDSDGTPDCRDGCPADAGKTAPGTCGCGTADTDSDGDGTPDCTDQCPADAGKTAPGTCGCGTADTDSDGDGTLDCNDGCPYDPGKVTPGVCGCGIADTDSDGDGTLDCNDGCPYDPGKVTPGVCGCGIADTDSDGDGTPDCIDNCPLLSNPDQLDANNNGIGDACEQLPDLNISWTSVKYTSKNKTLSGRSQEMNIGNLNAGKFTVAYYLSNNGTDLDTLIGTDTVSTLRVGRSVNSSLRYQSQTSLSGKYVIAVVDSGNQIVEKNENNNRTVQLIP